MAKLMHGKSGDMMKDIPTLGGYSRSPVSGGPARQLVVFLHGVGADGRDLMDLADDFAPLLPHAAFAAPDAPFPCDMAPYGRQWFSLQDRSAPSLIAGARRAAAALDAYLDGQLQHWRVDARHLALVGFSQGTMMALQVAPRRADSCGAVVGFAGALVDGDSLGSEIRSRPPMLLSHGAADMVVDPACLNHAAAALRQLGITVETQVLPGLGHEINQDGIDAAIRFVADRIG